MKEFGEFVSSPNFLWWTIGAVSFFAVVVFLWRNVSWFPRGITPTAIRGQVALPSMKVVTVVIGSVSLAIGLWWLWKAPSGALGSPSVADVVKLSQDYWLWVIVLWGIGHTLIGLKSSTLGKAAPVLHWVLPVAVFALFALLPIIGALSGSKTAEEVAAEKEAAARAAAAPAPKAAAKPVVPLATAPQAEWPKLPLPPKADVPIKLPPGMKSVDVIGDNFSLITDYADGSKCATSGEVKCKKGAVVGVHVENTIDTVNTVIYAFNPY